MECSKTTSRIHAEALESSERSTTCARLRGHIVSAVFEKVRFAHTNNLDKSEVSKVLPNSKESASKFFENFGYGFR